MDVPNDFCKDHGNAGKKRIKGKKTLCRNPSLRMGQLARWKLAAQIKVPFYEFCQNYFA